MPARALETAGSPTSERGPTIRFVVGVDGGGSGTRVRLARHQAPGDSAATEGSAAALSQRSGQALGVAPQEGLWGPQRLPSELARAEAGPSGLRLGIAPAWQAIGLAIARAFDQAGLPWPGWGALALGVGLAGVNHPEWAASFQAADPGCGLLVLASDAETTLLGAHQGGPGAVIAIGTGTIGMVRWPGGRQRVVGGWGFPSGDEGSGAWIGLQAVNHLEQVLDGRCSGGALSQALAAPCGRTQAELIGWVVDADASRYATLAPLVVAEAHRDGVALEILRGAGRHVADMARALDPQAELPLALCGGLAAPLGPHLPAWLVGRAVAPRADAAAGALLLVTRHLATASPAGGTMSHEPGSAAGLLDG